MHLNETELIDSLDGTLPAARAAHAETCPACRSQVETARAALLAAGDDPDHEPSPLFWDAFPSRVLDALDDRPRRGWWFGWRGLAAFACAAAVIIVAAATLDAPNLRRPAPDPASAAAPAAAAEPDDIEQDAAWAVVRTAAGDLDYDDALAQGIAASPGALEGAAMELSDAERAELIRLIQSELKRTGA